MLPLGLSIYLCTQIKEEISLDNGKIFPTSMILWSWAERAFLHKSKTTQKAILPASLLAFQDKNLKRSIKSVYISNENSIVKVLVNILQNKICKR